MTVVSGNLTDIKGAATDTITGAVAAGRFGAYATHIANDFGVDNFDYTIRVFLRNHSR
jgi:hypothetical protein